MSECLNCTGVDGAERREEGADLDRVNVVSLRRFSAENERRFRRCEDDDDGREQLAAMNYYRWATVDGQIR